MVAGIYQIYNKITNDYYIGSSIDIKKRFNRHKSDLGLNKHENPRLQNAYNKYGKDSFEFLIVESINDIDNLLVLEQQYFDLFFDDNKLYNINKIAGKGPLLKGENAGRAKLSKHQVDEIRALYKQRKHSIKELSILYQVCAMTMRSLLINKTWCDPEYIPEMQSSGFDYNNKRGNHSRKSKEQFIEDSINIHGDRYDYSKVEYINNITKVILICKEHGEFLTRPGTHLTNKRGCPKCGIHIISEKLKRKKNDQ